MADAYELALTWRGDLLRAELHHGTFEIWAGGTQASDLPLPVEGRHLLVRSDERGAGLFPLPAGAAWSLDEAEAQGAAAVVGESVARLQVGDLEIAIQSTSPPDPLPRWTIAQGTLRLAAAHIAAYAALVGLLNLPASAGGPPSPARVGLPRPLSLKPFPDSGPPPSFASGRRVTIAGGAAAPTSSSPSSAPSVQAAARRGRRRAAPVPAALLPDPPPGDQIEELATGTVEIARLDDLAEPMSPPGPCAQPDCGDEALAGGPGRGSSRGVGNGVGTCQRQHFEGLVARHGRTAAIVACSSGPRLGTVDPNARGDSVVLRDQGRDARLAAEVWVWDGARGRR